MNTSGARISGSLELQRSVAPLMAGVMLLSLMSTDMKRPALILSMLFLCASLLPHHARPQAAKRLNAAESARAFYQYHFSHNGPYDAASLRRRRRWLTAELYSLLRYELDRELPPDTTPYIEGDPFTGSQESPHTFRIGKATRRGVEEHVEVFVYWVVQRRVVEQRKYSFVMLREGGSWKIADIIDHNGGSLRQELRELMRKDRRS